MEKYELVLARQEELPVCMEVLNSGREFQRAQGFVQWPDGYPPQSEIERDIQNSQGYLLKADGAIAAYLYIGFQGDPAYPKIRGAWQTDEPYAVIHRVAIGNAFRGKGLADVIFRLAGAFCMAKGVASIRIDTDAQNKRMQHILEKNGFAYCGTVMQNGGLRMAFEKGLKVSR